MIMSVLPESEHLLAYRTATNGKSRICKETGGGRVPPPDMWDVTAAIFLRR
jgi:hypothetical protein